MEKRTKTLDSLVREILRKKEKWCFTCGATDNLEVGHFVPRRFLLTRWDTRNCHLQCIWCNRVLNGNLKVYRERLGALADELWAVARIPQKVDREMVYRTLKNELKSLGS